MILSQNSPEVKRIPLRYASDYRSYSIEEADRMRVIVDYPPRTWNRLSLENSGFRLVLRGHSAFVSESLVGLSSKSSDYKLQAWSWGNSAYGTESSYHRLGCSLQDRLEILHVSSSIIFDQYRMNYPVACCKIVLFQSYTFLYHLLHKTTIL